MSQSFDIQFLPLAPFGSGGGAPAMILRFLQQFTEGEYEDLSDGSHLPMVQPVRDLQRRVETLDAAATKYRNKSSEITSQLQGDLPICDDPETKVLTETLMRSHKMLADYLEGLHPILRDQMETVKALSEYLTPPTVELFQKKASHILKDAPLQQISMSKKNTCTICMDASADCVIKRTCSSPSSNPSSSSSQVRCERDTCKCGPTMCKDCLLTHYWTSTGKGSKSYARCVCCRAEFCLKDVFPVQYVEDEAFLAQQKSEQERKAKEREVKEEDKGRSRRHRKSSLAANNNSNNTTTTTTTTTSSSSSYSSSSPSSSSSSQFHIFPNFNSSSFSNSYFGSEDLNNNNDDYGNTSSRSKRRRTNTNNNSNNSNNHTSFHNNSNNNHNNNNNNDDSDNDGRSKYHLRSQRRSER